MSPNKEETNFLLSQIISTHKICGKASMKTNSYKKAGSDKTFCCMLCDGAEMNLSHYSSHEHIDAMRMQMCTVNDLVVFDWQWSGLCWEDIFNPHNAMCKRDEDGRFMWEDHEDWLKTIHSYFSPSMKANCKVKQGSPGICMCTLSGCVSHEMKPEKYVSQPHLTAMQSGKCRHNGLSVLQWKWNKVGKYWEDIYDTQQEDAPAETGYSSSD